MGYFGRFLRRSRQGGLNTFVKKAGRVYDDLKIKNKLFIIHLFIVLAVCSVSLLAFQVVLKIYDELLYNEASQVLNLSTATIENDLRRVEKASFSAVSDPNIQQYAQAIKNGLPDYEDYTYTDFLVRKLQALAASDNYVTAFIFIDTSGNQAAYGADANSLSQEMKQEVISRTSSLMGGNVFIEPRDGGASVLCARQLRATNNLSLEPLGTIVFQIDLEKLIQKYTSVLPKYNVNLLILSENKTIYGTKGFPPLNQEVLHFKGEAGYETRALGGQKMFISYTTSQYTKWVYANILPYENIFERVTILRYIILALFILLFITIVFISMYIARSLTKPIENLSTRMKRVEKGEFELEETDVPGANRMDEIGHLHRDFEIMVRKINTLIREDYTKQIVIKDAQLKALQAQINPHFLYNTLESINWLAKVNKQKSISLMVESLGSLLRSAISSKEKVITLSEELALLESYITIQKIRYENRLEFRMEVDGRVKACKIPKLTLQPIVENSINYGLEKMLDACRISVRSVCGEGSFEIVIEDNGPGIEEELLQKLQTGELEPKGFGIGLKNIDHRLKLIFGGQYGISVENKPEEGTRVSIKIPYEKGVYYV